MRFANNDEKLASGSVVVVVVDVVVVVVVFVVFVFVVVVVVVVVVFVVIVSEKIKVLTGEKLESFLGQIERERKKSE